MHTDRRGALLRTTAVGLAAASTLLLGACGGDTEGPETGASVEEVQPDPALPGVDAPGLFDNDFSDAGDFVGQQVTVSAEVDEVVSPTAFTLAGTVGTAADELLVLHAPGGPQIDEGSAVQVSGTVRERFEPAAAEEFVGSDLDDGAFTRWDGETYIEASAVALLPG